MSWFARLGRARGTLGSLHTAEIDRYVATRPDDSTCPLECQRLVVLDVETSGLSPRTDHLIAIGAVAAHGNVVRLTDSFYAVLRQEKASAAANILVHGIDGTTQTSAPDPAQSLVDFLSYAGKSPLVGFHAEFDRVFIVRSIRDVLGITLANAWLDLADLAPALYPEHAARTHTLDEWTARFRIENYARHDALADALATAQLLQILVGRAAGQNLTCFGDLAARAKEQRWLSHSLKAF
jgi:DNA polymerase III subunit epsilon